MIGNRQLSASQQLLLHERQQLLAERQYMQRQAMHGPPNAPQDPPVAQQNVNQQPQVAPVAVAAADPEFKMEPKMREGDAQAMKSISASSKSLPEKPSLVKPLGDKRYVLPPLIISLHLSSSLGLFLLCCREITSNFEASRKREDEAGSAGAKASKIKSGNLDVNAGVVGAGQSNGGINAGEMAEGVAVEQEDPNVEIKVEEYNCGLEGCAISK